MVNIQALINPRVPDSEALLEFAEALTDRAPDIERDMARLAQAPTDRVVIADIFRAMHNIKGDAAMCKVEMAALIAHPIESLLTRLRSGELRYSRMMGEAILLAVDRLELATEALVARKPLSHLKLVELVEGLEKLCLAQQSELDRLAAQVIQSVTGFRPQETLKAKIGKSSAQPMAQDHVVPDLHFFRSLAFQYEARSPLLQGRTGRILELAMETNRAAGSPVDATQLEAAVYMHDVGMMFLPESIWLKTGKVSEEERHALQAHPGLAAGLVERMQGWKAAAEMVLQHHEMPDGAGYPNGSMDDKICGGAKILAIVDAFEAVTLKHNVRGHKRSILRAIAEVNACDKQFAPEWIEPFNTVVRRMLEQQ
ncbi:MAG: HD domain-containing protein [Gammaproteobacteria bacterium]|nr:HD domain-containing protein [Gammaproteobacteria bacterium]MBU1730784.1 HD domain-containing protein [Gammaproteobacteria bacterium]MBU1891330.1 HD domain-containing protein [Gammaproteobacteria bacterium]